MVASVYAKIQVSRNISTARWWLPLGIVPPPGSFHSTQKQMEKPAAFKYAWCHFNGSWDQISSVILKEFTDQSSYFTKTSNFHMSCSSTNQFQLKSPSFIKKNTCENCQWWLCLRRSIKARNFKADGGESLVLTLADHTSYACNI